MTFNTVLSHYLLQMFLVFGHNLISHFMQSEIRIRDEFSNYFICANVIKMWPVCGVTTVVIVALNRCAVIIADILKLVLLVPIAVYPCDIIFAQVKYFNWFSFGILCMFIVNLDAYRTMQNFNNGVCVSMVMHWTVIALWPNFQKHIEFQGTFLYCVQEWHGDTFHAGHRQIL